MSAQSVALHQLSQAFPYPDQPTCAYCRLRACKAAFYETEALRGGWSVRQLDRQIGSQFYERTVLSCDKVTMLDRGGEAAPDDLVKPTGWIDSVL